MASDGDRRAGFRSVARTAARAAARMAAGIACAAVAALALLASMEPPPGPDPVQRFAVAELTVPPVDAIAPDYATVADLQSGVRPFGLVGRFILSYTDLLAAPTGSVAGTAVLPRQSDQPEVEPPADLAGPAPDAQSGAIPHSPLPDPAAPGPAAAPPPPVDLANAPAALPAPEPEPAGPAHFLQGGYFAERRNALDFAEELADAGLPVRIEQAANQAGRPRWIVLVGPYAETQGALGAREAAPGLLGEAFAVQRRD